MKTIIKPIPLSLELSFTLLRDGLRANIYTNVNDVESDKEVEFDIKYSDLEESYFEDCTFKRNEIEVIDKESALEMKKEIANLRSFVDTMELRLNMAMKNSEM